MNDYYDDELPLGIWPDHRLTRAEGRSGAPETRTDLWGPFGNDGMRYMESADVTGGATDMGETDG